MNNAILYLYPAARRDDYALRDDGEGPYIEHWNAEKLGPQPTVAELEAAGEAAILQFERDRTRRKITIWRDEQERGSIVFEHAGRRWDGGLAVRQRIVPMLGLSSFPEGFYWTDADDNDVRPFTPADLAALHPAHEAAIAARGWEIHTRQRDMKQEIETLDAAALSKYVVGWPALELP